MSENVFYGVAAILILLVVGGMFFYNLGFKGGIISEFCRVSCKDIGVLSCKSDLVVCKDKSVKIRDTKGVSK